MIVPEYGQVKKYAEEHHIAYTDMKDLLQKQEILDLFRLRIDTLQQEFAHYEQSETFYLLVVGELLLQCINTQTEQIQYFLLLQQIFHISIRYMMFFRILLYLPIFRYNQSRNKFTLVGYNRYLIYITIYDQFCFDGLGAIYFPLEVLNKSLIRSVKNKKPSSI